MSATGGMMRVAFLRFIIKLGANVGNHSVARFVERFSRENRAAAIAVLALMAFVVVGLFNRAQTAGRPFSARQLMSRLRGDSDLVSGSLSNGLRYTLQNNGWPEKRIELRLVVNAGSVLETDAQRGLAHAVEHMLFRGTKNFPARAIDNYLQSIGMRSGRDLNAWTSRDETVYSITIPTDRAGALDTAVAILADMAHAATFDSTEAHTEAGIVFEEWRSSRGAGARFSERRNELLLAGSKYALRAPIGDTAVLRRFEVSAMRAFYTDWYRPELMGLVIVGDIDPFAVRKIVRKHFGAIPANSPRKQRPVMPVPLTGQLRAATLEDDEATSTRISLRFPHSKRAFKTADDYREWAISQIWHDALNMRLEDLADTVGSPLLWTDADVEFPVRQLQVEVISANITGESVLRSLDMVVSEIARLKQHGLTERELNERSDAFLKQRWQNTEWNPGSESLADSYVRQFASDDIVMTPQAQYDLAERILPTITLDDIKRSAQRALSDSGILILITRPTDRTRATVSDEELVAHVRALSNRNTTALTEKSDSIVLIATPPAPGHISSEVYVRDIETFDIKLSNGLRVLAKPSSFTNDNIEFRLIAPGGASLASDADYPSAYMSDGVISSLGVGPISGLKLDRMLKASSLTFRQQTSNESIDIHGDLAPRDLDRFFQLLHLTLTAPRNDSSAFRRYRERLLSNTLHRDADPDVVFDDTVSSITMPHSARAIRDNAVFLKAIDLPKTLAFWKARSANASGFTLVMTGAFQIAPLRPLLEQYLASLPAGVPEQPRDDGVRFPGGVVNRAIYVGAGPRAKTRIMLSGSAIPTVETSEAMRAVGDIAERVLGDKLRESMGGTYDVSVDFDQNLVPAGTYQLAIEFEASPERIDSLAKVALAEMSRLSTTGPTQNEFEKTRAALTRDYDNTAESNSYWTSELSQHARLGWSLSSITTHQQRFKDLKLPALRDACAKYLKPSEYVRVTMFPQRQPRRN